MRIDFARKTLTAQEDRRDYFSAIVARFYSDPQVALKILDLGCGSGHQLLALGRHYPNAALQGVDISPENIATADTNSQDKLFARRTRFAVADYLSYWTEPQDVIATYSTLQWLPGDTRVLLEKIARDLRAGGHLICCMPFECLRNRLLVCCRSVLIACRCRPLDRLIFAFAKLAHGQRFSPAALWERVPYMYILPERFEGREFESLARAVGLEVVARFEAPHESLFKMKHRTTVYRKTLDRTDPSS